ncbi:3D domain-containing protein [Desulfonatronum thiodismutans]|uniref:3D domain-containing protein n=1 Tax=Desulfonatronum thiodismutans TaxID=159290 RepID=UPI00068B300D|nr:3D domain-containing protein [Desulfonatronum thiodismutans]
MRFSLPIILILALTNVYLLVQSGARVQDMVPPSAEESLVSAEHQLELLKAQDKITILKLMLDRYREANTHRLRLTAYTARPEETNEDVENTAIMQTPRPGWTVAVSQDLRGWLGKRVYVEGFGVRFVGDLMNPRYSKSIDVLVADVEEARDIGVILDVFVTLIEPLLPEHYDGDFDITAVFNWNRE